jgi:ADP-ribose pyrophosphatase YjhB (NUDIX family)
MQKEEKILYFVSIVFCVNILNQVWLAKKSRKIGKGCLNGYGGGKEEWETMEACATRELKDESSVIAEEKDLEKVAFVYFHNITSDGVKFITEGHVYILRKWQGEFKETEDAGMLDPKPHPIENLPLKKMMVGDRDWVPQVLSGKKLIVHVYYGPLHKKLLQPTEITYVNCF